VVAFGIKSAAMENIVGTNVTLDFCKNKAYATVVD
jgi:hypothetical protein